MTDYHLLVTADLLLAVNFAVNKVYQRKHGTGFSAGFLFSMLTGAFTAIIIFIYNGFAFAITPFSLLIAVISALLCTFYTLLGFRIMKRQGMSLYTLFLMCGGMTVPFLYGVLFLSESVSPLRIAGLCVIICGMVFTCIGSEKPDKISIALCVIVFFLNGGVSIVSKLHSITTDLAVEPREFVVLSGIVSFAVNLVLFCIFSIKKKEEKADKLKPSVFIILLPFFAAAAGGISSVLQLTGAQHIDASLLYPFITGGSIVFSTLTGAIAFREKLTKNTVIGICLAFCGTLLFL